MSLKRLIINKTTGALAVIYTLFASANAFAQEAAAAAVAKPVDMTAVNKTALYYVLLFLLLCLFIAIVGKALRIYDLTKETEDKKGIDWDNINGILFGLFLIVGCYGVYWEYTVHGELLLSAASEHGEKIDQMFNITLILTTIVFIATHIALFTFTYLYKYDSNKKAYYYPHNNTIEKIWTIAPALVLTVLVLMGFLTWRSIFFKIDDPKNMPISIEVTSSQFQWDFRYPGADDVVGKKNYKLITSLNGLGIDFNDKNSLDDQVADELVIPVNKPVRMILTSKDVIHSFYMPHFRIQLNTVPGMTSYFEFTPTLTTEQMKTKINDPTFKYILLCAKICGTSHFNMQKVVRVVSQEEYNAWVVKQSPYLTNDLRKEFKLPVIAEPTAAPATVSDTTAKDTAAKSNQLALLKK